MTITIEYKTYNRLVKTLQHWQNHNTPGSMPYVFLLGSENNKTINRIKQIPERHCESGCWQMPALSGNIISKYAVQLIRKGCVVMGLARVGSFSHSYEHNLVGVWEDPFWTHKEWLFLSIENGKIFDPRQSIILKIIKEG